MVADHPLATFDPAYIDIASISGGETLRFKSSLTIPNISTRTADVHVWAQLENPIVGMLETAKAVVKVEAKPSLAGLCENGIVRIRNVGSAPASVTIEADVPLPATWVQPLAIGAGGDIELALPSEPVGVVRFIEQTSRERLVVVDRRSPIEPPELTARGEVRGAEGGVRIGDLVPLEINIANSGGPAYETSVALELPVGVVLVNGYTTRDDVPLLPQDLRKSKRHVSFSVGCVQTGERTSLRAAVRIEEVGTEVDTMTITGEVVSGFSRDRLRFSAPISRVPMLVGHNTYFSPLRDYEQGFLKTVLTITNAHGTSVRDAAVAFCANGVQIESVSIEGRPLPLAADAVEDGILAEIGTLHERTRASVEVIASRLPGAREARIEARLVVQGRTVPLADITQPLLVEPRVSLTVTPQRDSRVRLGMKCLLEVNIANSGTDTLRGARIRPIVPEGVNVRIPLASDDGWYPIGAPLAPVGGKTGFPVIVELTEPPRTERIDVVFEVDSDNAPAVRSKPLELMTPSSPSLSVSAPQIRDIGERGLVEVKVRIANRSDGVATGVWVAVRPEDRPVPYTATLDGQSIDERDRPVMVEGISLGDLPPNSQRDVAWLAAPQRSAYQTRITVRAEPRIERIVEGGIELDERGWFTTEPHAPRPINEATPITGVDATTVVRATITDIEQQALEQRDGPRALGGATIAEESRGGGALAGAQNGSGSVATPPPALTIAESLRQPAATPQNADSVLAFLDRVAPLELRDSTATSDTNDGGAPGMQETVTGAAENGAQGDASAQNGEHHEAQSTESQESQEQQTQIQGEALSANGAAHASPTPDVQGADPATGPPVGNTTSIPSPEPEQEEVPERVEQYGLSIVELIRGVVSSEQWNTALTQSVVMRLVGPAESPATQRRELAVAHASELLVDGIGPQETRDWMVRMLTQWAGRAPDPDGDMESLRELQNYPAPPVFADVFDDYLNELESVFPVRIDGDRPYVEILQDLGAARIVEALADLARAVAPC
jgi:hypothetical protein